MTDLSKGLPYIYHIHVKKTVSSSGSTDVLYVAPGKVLELLIRVGSITGSPSIQYHIDVIEPISGDVIKTYDGSSLTSAPATDYIYVANDIVGMYVKVRWDGTLDSSNYFSGVNAILMVKR